MQDAIISLLGTGAVMPFITAYIIGWADTKQIILTTWARLRAFWMTVGEDASDW